MKSDVESCGHRRLHLPCDTVFFEIKFSFSSSLHAYKFLSRGTEALIRDDTVANEGRALISTCACVRA